MTAFASSMLTNIQGAVASGVVDTGNPVKVGGKYNASPVTLADGQRGDFQLDANGFLKINQRLLTSSDVVTIAGGSLIASAYLYDGFGNQIRSVSPTGGINQIQANIVEAVQVANWNATAFTTTPVTYGPVNSRNFREAVIAVNITATSGGMTFQYQVQDANGNWVVAWTEAFGATGVQYICVGPGYTAGTARNISMGFTGRLNVFATTTSGTLTGTAWMRTN